ncbi:CocE/NonD family hydrolase [Virgibacillus sediminis]|uniref:CocE/NonD family hydrolase n=1 Tax=Virgibacillus sediminis TaxID=202260 RepID=A0ABV7A4N9_9BACI
MKEMIMEANVECILSDGTVLRADIYRPNQEESFPALMIRLPYDKRTRRYYDEYLSVPRMVSAGYVVILQDVRGRYASDGEFYPFIHEGSDGYEAVEWAARLPYCNGDVGLFGMSYHGYTQLAAAVEAPPSLKAIAPVMTMGDPWSELLSGGSQASNVGNIETWTIASIMEDVLARRSDPKLEKVSRYIEELPEWLHYAPANEWPPMMDLDPESFFFDAINGLVKEEHREKMSLLSKLPDVKIPALFMGGWFDALLPPTLKAYQAYGGTSMLWIGPWTHEEMSGRAGDKFFAGGAEKIGVDGITDPTELHIAWFNKWLKNEQLPMEEKVHLYLTGQERWESFDSWPPISSRKEFYLSSDGASQSRYGDGLLKGEPDHGSTASLLKLDPEHPFPTNGGGVLMAGQSSGMFEQGQLQDRDDVLVYTSAVLEEDLDILGTVRAVVWMSSPTPLLDVFIRLSDVEPDGKVYNLVDTFYRHSVTETDKPVRLGLDINDTAYRFQTGHHIRVEIAASNAPMFDVNLNNGKTTRTAVGGEVAFEKVFHGGETPSRIILPVVE